MESNHDIDAGSTSSANALTSPTNAHSARYSEPTVLPHNAIQMQHPSLPSPLAAGAADSPLKAAVNCVWKPVGISDALDPLLLERCYAVPSSNSASWSPVDDAALRRQLWHSLHNAVFYVVKELHEDSHAPKQSDGTPTEKDEDAEDSYRRYRVPVRMRARGANSAQQKSNESASAHATRATPRSAAAIVSPFTTIQWMFTQQCLTQFEYPRKMIYLQTIADAHISELVLCLLWLTKKFHFALLAIHVELNELFAENEGMCDFLGGELNSAAATAAVPSWLPHRSSFDEAASTAHRVAAIRAVCAPLQQQNAKHRADEEGEVADSDAVAKVVLSLHRMVRLHLNHIESLLETRCHQVEALALHLPSDGFLCLPQNHAYFERIVALMKRLNGLPERLHSALGNVKQCGSIVLSHMRSCKGGVVATRSSGDYVDSVGAAAADDAQRAAHVTDEQRLNFRALYAKNTTVRAATDEVWQRVAKTLSHSNHGVGGAHRVDAMLQKCRAQVADSIRMRYSLVSAMDAEYFTVSGGTAPHHGGIAPAAAQCETAAVEDAANKKPAVCCPHLLTTLPPLLDQVLRSDVSSASHLGIIPQDTAVGAPAVGRTTSASMEFKRLRDLLHKLEVTATSDQRAQGPAPKRSVGWKGLDEFIQSNGLRFVNRKPQKHFCN